MTKPQNIQIVKVQVGDVRKKRKAKKKGKGKPKKAMVGTGLAPVLGQTQYNYPPFAPMTSRMGTQFEPPKLQVVEPKKDETLKDEYVQSLDQLKKLQEYMKGKGEAPSPWNVPSSAPPSPFEAGNYWTVPRFTDTPPRPIDRPQQPLVAAEAAASSSVLFKPSREYLRSLSLDQLNQLAASLNLGAGKGLDKELLIEVLVGYRPRK